MDYKSNEQEWNTCRLKVTRNYELMQTFSFFFSLWCLKEKKTAGLSYDGKLVKIELWSVWHKLISFHYAENNVGFKLYYSEGEKKM